MDNLRRYRHPDGKFGATALNWVANNSAIRNFRRSLLTLTPFPTLESDVKDVLYLNWIVPINSTKSLVPEGVKLINYDGNTILTILIYRHGHFGPAFIGPLRKLFPSPLQSNWRYYVSTPTVNTDQSKTVLFIKNYFDTWVHAVGTRIGSDALPSDYAPKFSHSRQSGVFSSHLENWCNEIELSITAEADRSPSLPQDFSQIFGSWTDAILEIALQDSAIVQPPDLDRLAAAGISLPIDISAVEPLEILSYSAGPLLRILGANHPPFAFCVPEVNFKVLWEKLLTKDAN